MIKKEDFKKFYRIHKYARTAKVFGHLILKALDDSNKYSQYCCGYYAILIG